MFLAQYRAAVSHGIDSREKEGQMSAQQLTTMVGGVQVQADTDISELQEARKEIAKLRRENAQLELIQQQTERLLSVQGDQMRERVRTELRRMDTALQQKEQELQELRALQKQLNQKIHALQIELAEKMLLLETRINEVNQLKSTVQRLSENSLEQA
jgi:chromosome segregation ATPase